MKSTTKKQINTALLLIFTLIILFLVTTTISYLIFKQYPSSIPTKFINPYLC